jgi:uncharacterized protein
MGPISAVERIQVVDVLRGFALFGILLVDMNLFLAQPTGAWERTVALLIEFFAKDSFYPLFSLLFGLGFAIQLERANARGADFVPLYMRRLVILLLIGIAHNILTVGFAWILIRYALLGFPLMLFRHCKQSTILVWALLSLLVAIVAMPVKNHMGATGKAGPPADTRYAAIQPADTSADRPAIGQPMTRGQQLRTEGSYLELVAFRAKRLVRTMSRVEFYLAELPNVFTLFLLGLYAARRGIVQHPAAHLRLLRSVLVWGLAAGLLGNSLDLLKPAERHQLGPLFGPLVSNASLLVGGMGLGLVYASAIILLARNEWWRKLFSPLAWPGRMALTNYLLQWSLCAFIFYGYGCGYYQTVGPLFGVALTLAIYAAEVWLSRLWLTRFPFGPVEWLWRTLTYGRLRLRKGNSPSRA